MYSPGEPIITRAQLMEECQEELAQDLQMLVEDGLCTNYSIEAARNIVKRIIEEVSDET